MAREGTSVRAGNAPQPSGAYSQGVVAGGFLFTSGFGSKDPVTGELDEGITNQTHRVLRNIEAALAAYGLGLDDVVKVTVHLQSLQRDFLAFDEAYREIFAERYPVRTTVGRTLRASSLRSM